MEPVDLQFFAFFVVVLAGALLGLLFDVLRAVRGYYRLTGIWAALGDLLFWVFASAVGAAGIVLGNWGELRLFILVGLGLGLLLHYYLASHVAIRLVIAFLRLLNWIWSTLVWVFMRVFVGPIVLILSLLWQVVGWIWGWLRWGAGGLLSLTEWIGVLFWRPLYRGYRCMRLHYLLGKRRLKRKLRAWLLPPPDDGE